MKSLTQAKKLIKDCQDTQNPYLDLGRCGITDLSELPELFECKHLETLILSNSWYDNAENKLYESNNIGEDNLLSSIPKRISNLKKLTKLIIGDNDNIHWSISDISFLEKLTSLQYLDLSFNQISDINSLEKLTNLQYLNLGFNQIFDISSLEKLTNLQSLYLGENQISDISSLEKLTNLQFLGLSKNQISDYSSLEKLTNLQSLDLRFSYNFDISSLEKLTKLQELRLNDNEIKKIPLSIFRLNMEINRDRWHGKKELFLYGNPIESPPVEVIEQGKKAVFNWFEKYE